jgi:hypothetical protein
MTTPIELRTMDDLARFAKAAAQSGYFQDAQQAAQALVKIAYGKELGLGPVAALSGVHVVKGNPTLSATTIAALIKRSGKYNFRVKQHTATECVLAFTEDGEHVGDSTFTMDDARAAQLTSNNMWKKYARNMLFARALTNGARWFCTDVFMGPVYTPDEVHEGAADLIEATATDVTEARTEDEPKALPERQRVNEGTVSAILDEADRLGTTDDALLAAVRSYGDGVESIEDMSQADAEAMLSRMRAKHEPVDEREARDQMADISAPDGGDEVTDAEWADAEAMAGEADAEEARSDAVANLVDDLVQAWPMKNGRPCGPKLLAKLKSCVFVDDVKDVCLQLPDDNPFKDVARGIFTAHTKRR